MSRARTPLLPEIIDTEPSEASADTRSLLLASHAFRISFLTSAQPMLAIRNQTLREWRRIRKVLGR